MKTVCILLTTLLLFTCSRDGRNKDNSEVGAASQTSKNVARDFRKMPADASKYKSITDAKDWRNPFLTIRPNGVGIRVRAISMSEERIIPIGDLKKTLTSLPLSAWPYGNVIVVSEIGIRSGGQEEAELIERNKKELKRILNSLGTTVEWWPSA
ncbi:MAG TPA: hypothetical protein VLJ61_10395 [Pyrinomonadaceae bacterium]|nr:hypothetical protein [Pyrinomonadaceae bacterium]